MHKEAKKHSDSLLKMKTNRGWWQSSLKARQKISVRQDEGDILYVFV